ncbi:C2 family cysteine protease [Allocoleopsis franciscana]|uniref:Putative pre-peptidase n=1 Tax=Allocoleopsis franciscana PCC 7113 TaxID=1173027 RepID=K9WJ87_9CYAN|nr:C2 family cysteine protease [Allocoleopsis franciscana]AFZ20253.1 putative pre-peptidase [Allocoleopsis franciscana PCC 7113]
MLDLTTNSKSFLEASVAPHSANLGETVGVIDLITPESAIINSSLGGLALSIDESFIEPIDFLSSNVEALTLIPNKSEVGTNISTSTSTGSNDKITGQPLSDIGVTQLNNTSLNSFNLTTINSQIISDVAVLATDPNGTIATADSVGTLTTSITQTGQIGGNESYGKDTRDYWKFSVNSDFKVNLSLSGLSGNAGLALYNSAGKLLTWSNHGGANSESISHWLGKGDYYALVYSEGNWGGSTNYNLGLQAGTQLSSLITDYTVHQAVSSRIGDGQIDRNDMIAILRSTKDGSVIAEEINDLRDILNDAKAFGLDGYVQNLANKVVNGNVANQKYKGAALGNLFAGSSATHMESLVDKWFLGGDHPVAKSSSGNTTYSYKQASGSLFQNGISYQDIDQGGVGDCYFVASLAGTAFRSPDTIRDMFIDNNDGTFTVRFFNGDKADYVTVDKYLPTTAGGNAVFAGWGGGSYNESNNELWVALAEKAYAQINESAWIGQDNTNSYQGIAYGTLKAISHITGLNNTGYKDLEAGDFNSVVNAFNADRIIYLSDGGHAYTLVGYNATTQMFKVYNPYGSTQDMTWTALDNKFVRWGYSTT